MAAPGGIAGVFDRSASTYDAVGVPWFTPIAAGLVAELAVQPGERVLDAGCGRGAALRPLAEAAGPDGQVLGIDLAPEMVRLTALDLAALPQVRVQVADASDPGLPAGSFDVVAASLVLFFLPDPRAALAAWVSLLAPGGRLGISTFGPQDERWKAVDALFLPYLPQQLKDARTSGARGPFGSDQGVEDLFTAAGLTQVRTTHQTVDAEFRDAEHWVEFSWSHGQRVMWEHVPGASRGAVRAQVIAELSRFAEPDGRITFSQQVRYTLGLAPSRRD